MLNGPGIEVTEPISRARARNNRLPNYLRIFTDRPVEHFLTRVLSVQSRIDQLALISPYIGLLNDTQATLEQLLHKIDREHIKTTVITTAPTGSPNTQRAALDLVNTSDYTQIYFNPALHAKLYICSGGGVGFALFGSGNLTQTSVNQKIELGMLVSEFQEGGPIFKSLEKWGLHHLRVTDGTVRIKDFNKRGRF